MKLTLSWLQAEGACAEGIAMYRQARPRPRTIETAVAALLAADYAGWANWLVAHALNKKNRIRYVVYAAEQVLPIFEKAFHADNRPRKAIETAAGAVGAVAWAVAWAAAGAAGAAVLAARVEIFKKIIAYGIKLLEVQKNSVVVQKYFKIKEN